MAPAKPLLTHFEPGQYLVGIDIEPGTYKGQAGTEISDSCYWERQANLTGGLYAINGNDNSIGQYYVQVLASDKALVTHCAIDFVSP